MKTVALDIGDRWTGVAISDPLGILARPYETAKTTDLIAFLEQLIAKEQPSTIVVGLPTTLRGTESDQTKKVRTVMTELQEKFSTVTWIFWDERLTSKQAARIKPSKSKDDKIHSHAIAAALILSSYLEYRHFNLNASEK